MNSRIDENLQLTDLKKLEVEIQDWIIENALIIIELYTDKTTSTMFMEGTEEDQFMLLENKVTELKRKMKNLINDVSNEKIPYVFHRLIIIVIKLLRDFSDFRNAAILNAITQIYISVLSELKIDEPLIYSSLEPYQQFSPDTFYFIGNQLSKDNDLVKIIDEEYWKDDIFKRILEREETKILKHSIRALILYCNTINNRKKRLLNLKK